MRDWTLFWLVAPGLATGLGGLGLLVVGRPSERLLDTLLGVTGGIMMAAAMFSLLVPGLEQGTVAEVVLGVLAGAALLVVLDAYMPHVHARFRERSHSREQRRAALLLSALTIHNLPEGLAVGVAFAAGGAELGIPLAVAIGLQNLPEGFAAAAPLVAARASTWSAIGFAAATGLVEPPAAALGYAVADSATTLLPFALAFAGGAMIYVVIDEMLPESREHGNEREATGGFVLGFVVMMLLDNALG
ncbi:MAG TPA: ZIP family metal transporter [Gaiellaceae bacterium]|nr:ZIP family metal transporter [Gaiellaceae bacterium]